MKFRSMLSFSPRPRFNLKPCIGCLLLLTIAFNLSAFIMFIGTNTSYLALVAGMIFGTILEIYLDLETIFIFNIIFLTLVMLLTECFSTSLFEKTIVLIAVLVVANVATIACQRLIKKWICSVWGKSIGLAISTFTICLGIILQYL